MIFSLKNTFVREIDDIVSNIFRKDDVKMIENSKKHMNFLKIEMKIIMRMIGSFITMKIEELKFLMQLCFYGYRFRKQ